MIDVAEAGGPLQKCDSGNAQGRRAAGHAETRLTPRERQVLALLSEGLSSKEIALRMSLADGTIKSYRKSLYGKLAVSRRSHAIALYRRSVATTSLKATF